MFPLNGLDSVLLAKHVAEVHFQPGVTADNLREHQASFYRKPHGGRLCVVLGGGNINAIPPTDVLYKLFVDTKTRVMNTGATGVFGWLSSDQGHPVYIGIDDVDPAQMTNEKISAMRTIVRGVTVMDNGRIVHRGDMVDLAADVPLQERLLGLSLEAHQ